MQVINSLGILNRLAERLADESCKQIKDAQGIYYLHESPVRGGKLAFLFPGLGGQHVGMLSDLCINFPLVRECFDNADRAITSSGMRPLSRDIFPPSARSDEESAKQENRLAAIERANPAACHRLQVHSRRQHNRTVQGATVVRSDFAPGHFTYTTNVELDSLSVMDSLASVDEASIPETWMICTILTRQPFLRSVPPVSGIVADAIVSTLSGPVNHTENKPVYDVAEYFLTSPAR